MEFKEYLNIRSVIDGSIRADGRRMAFLYNPSGTQQIFTSDTAQGWASQRTFYPNRVTFVRYAPQGNHYIFGMDEGGNELEQFYLGSDDNPQVTALTKQASAKHIWGCWNAKGTHIALSATRENDTDFFVYTLEIATQTIQKVSDLGGYNYVLDWHNNTLLVAQAQGNDENNLYLLDLETQEKRLITPHTGKATFLAARFSPDGQFVWCSSNLNREFSNLVQINLSDLSLEWKSNRIWDEESFALDGDYLCVSSNQAGLSVVELIHQPTGKTTIVSGVPVGVTYVLKCWLENHFLLIGNGANSAYNLYLLKTDGTFQQWTNADLGLIPASSLTEPQLVKWTSFDGLDISGWYYQAKATNSPVIISIHGGPESQSRPDFMALAQYWVSRGMSVLYPNVRGSTGYGKTFMGLDDVEKRMDSVADIKAAVEWLVQTGKADPKRIAVYGGSYGGFMVLSCLTTYPELFACGVDIVGISNFVTFLERTSAYRRALRESEYGSLANNREFLSRISPINHLEKLQAPLFIVHGANDPRVPLHEAEQIRDALNVKHIPVEFLVYPDEGHGLAKLQNRLDAYPKIAAFLEQHLKPEVTL